MSWISQNDRDHFVYGAGNWSKYYWDSAENPNATFQNCLANCTTLCYGRAIENGWAPPVTVIRNANRWHEFVNTDGGWQVLDYTSGMELKAGDIVEWVGNNHVATIEEDGTDPYQSSSWYTGDDGTGNTDRSSIMGTTLQSVSNWMMNNYPYRFYHYTKFSTEKQQGGGGVNPTYVLRYSGEEPPEPTTEYIYIPFKRNRKNKIIIRRY